MSPYEPLRPLKTCYLSQKPSHFWHQCHVTSGEQGAELGGAQAQLPAHRKWRDSWADRN